MDADIQFGDLKQPAPRRKLRPDRNHHYAVVSCDCPSDEDLPIYIDMDVARDIEAHARSDTTIELGGVLLGGRYEDQNGDFFVVITDSLRAEHYEAHGGSFKFTRETWTEITRRRNQFPEETEMVGWYHTHPGWGVFLSGMDTFICEHFFAQPLDVALVVDPCRSRRVFFQWSRDGERGHLRATGGYHVTSSRFRQSELEVFKAQLEGAVPMPSDPRHSERAGSASPSVIQITEPRQTWLILAVLGLFLVQFSVLALIAWRGPPGLEPQSVGGGEWQPAQVQAQREFLDDIIGKLDVAPDGLVRSLEKYRRQNQELETVKLGLMAHIGELEESQRALERENEVLLKQHQELRATIAQLKRGRDENQDKIAELKAKLEEYGEAEVDSQAGSGLWAWVTRWKWYLAAAGLLLLIGVAMLLASHGVSLGTHGSTGNEPLDQE
ncbi:MAG: Mov34/MPN/PAD-1 family protein [Pirellulaceae bacterium]